MTSAEPVRPPAPRAREVQASVLAALQLVEDARVLGGRYRGRRGPRQAAERALVARRLAVALRAG